MEFMFDTADLKLIRRYEDMIPYTGITTNPALIRKAGIRTGLFDALREIHRCVSSGKSLHIQVVSHDSREMIREAMYIRKQVGEDVCIKVPVTPDGMTAMKYLKTQGVRLTATTVVTPVQAMLALELEPDFIAPYYTQMCGLGTDGAEVIRLLADTIERKKLRTRVLAANIQDTDQLWQVYRAGAHCATLNPRLLEQALQEPAIPQAVRFFDDAWKEAFGEIRLTDCR